MDVLTGVVLSWKFVFLGDVIVQACNSSFIRVRGQQENLAIKLCRGGSMQYMQAIAILK